MTPSKEQMDIMKEFQDICCFEFSGKSEVRAEKPEEFIRKFESNISFLRDTVEACADLILDYEMEYRE